MSTTGYREAHPRCPACRGELAVREVGPLGAAVDVCPDCGGIWVDWHDGELTEIARSSQGEGRGSRRPPEPGLSPLCPRCRRVLHEESYRDGPFILRCGECAGAFVPRASAPALASLTLPEAESDAGEAGFFRRLIGRVQRAIGLGG